MHFCSKCHNMYYIHISSNDANKLVYHCNNCGNEDADLINQNTSVSSIYLKKKEQSLDNIINRYTKLDPTLLRVNNLLCPNKECDFSKSENSNKEIICIRYDDVNMKYAYLCSKCDSVWTI